MITAHKRFSIFASLTFSVLALALTATAAQAQSVATLTQVKGDVMTRAWEASPDAWAPGLDGSGLHYGDTVKTTSGSCVIRYESGTIELGPNTEVIIREETDSVDVLLTVGALSVDIDSSKAEKPFQFVTPTAVAAVRGTQVSLDFDGEGLLTIDLGEGNLFVYNDEAEMEFDLEGGNKVAIFYDHATGALSMTNECESNNSVDFIFQGQVYSTSPCEETNLELATAAPNSGLPLTGGDNTGAETVPNEGAENNNGGGEPPITEPNIISPTI